MNDSQPPPFDFNPNPPAKRDVQYPDGEKSGESGASPRRRRGAAFEPIEVSFTVTLDFWQGGFVSKQLDDPRIATSRITADQAVALKLLACSLNRQGVRTANHRYVQSNPDALRYLLDQVVEQIPAKLMQELKKEAC